MIKTKLVSAFARKFSPDVVSEALARYLREKLCRDVTRLKIDTDSSRFSSFKITAECNEVGEMYEPEGTCVRRFYKAFESAAVGSLEGRISRKKAEEKRDMLDGLGATLPGIGDAFNKSPCSASVDNNRSAEQQRQLTACRSPFVFANKHINLQLASL
ncbi:hypothetical protein EYF80_010276 [Liparis tanakae]|uniref:Uncharacterized protein n=1 Tax=Liparis tanakae TaxID=230148 RepID=A0A4Z2IQG9_9TELE|nr:hypothetical protein EYF80_010276 [Liparis tanakae]